MIAVITSAIMLEVFTVFLILKIFIYEMKADRLTIAEFFIWHVLLVFPKILSICVAAKTADKARQLHVLVEKYSSHCSDAVFQDVKEHNFEKYSIQSFKFFSFPRSKRCHQKCTSGRSSSVADSSTSIGLCSCLPSAPSQPT